MKDKKKLKCRLDDDIIERFRKELAGPNPDLESLAKQIQSELEEDNAK
jgi:hypothetical protein